MRRLVWIFLALAGCGWAQSNNTCNSNGCPPVVYLNYSPLGLPCNNGPQVGYYNSTQYVCSNSVVVAANSSTASTFSLTGTPSMVTPVNTGLLNLGVAPYTDTGMIENFWYNYNGYIYNIIGNTSTGASASACYVIGSSATTALTGYGELCLNGTGFSGAGEYNAPNATLLDSVGGDLGIGTVAANDIHIFVNSGRNGLSTREWHNRNVDVHQPRLHGKRSATAGHDPDFNHRNDNDDYRHRLPGNRRVLCGDVSGQMPRCVAAVYGGWYGPVRYRNLSSSNAHDTEFRIVPWHHGGPVQQRSVGCDHGYHHGGRRGAYAGRDGDQLHHRH
jgi:hypothetical protein